MSGYCDVTSRPGAREEPRLAGRHLGEAADAVELGLEPPAVVVERLPAALGEHRLEPAAATRSAARPARSRGTRASRCGSSRSGTPGPGSAGRAAERDLLRVGPTRSARTSRRRRSAPRRRRSGPPGSCRRTSRTRGDGSSVRTASRLSPFTVGRPFGTAQDGSAAFRSKPHVVVQPRGAVLVDHERVALALGAARRRLGRPLEVALADVLGQVRVLRGGDDLRGGSRRRRSPLDPSGRSPAPRTRSSDRPPPCACRRTDRRRGRTDPRRCRCGSPAARTRPRRPRPR